MNSFSIGIIQKCIIGRDTFVGMVVLLASPCISFSSGIYYKLGIDATAAAVYIWMQNSKADKITSHIMGLKANGFRCTSKHISSI